MINKVLEGAGFIKNKTYRETRFVTTPRQTFAVYHVSISRDGADYLNAINEYDVSIDLYEYQPDTDAEKRIEREFDKYSIPYVKQERYFIQDEQLYQVIYEFSYKRKELING